MTNALAAYVLLGGSNATFAGSTTTSDTRQVLNKQEIKRVTPWDDRITPPPLSQLAARALSAPSLIDTSLGGGAGSAVRDKDDKALFVLHEATRKLQALADAASSDALSPELRKRFSTRFDKGLEEINAYIQNTDLDRAYLVAGKKLSTLTSSTLGRPSSTYVGAPIWRGSLAEPVTAFEGDVRFTMAIAKNGVTTDVAIDLAGMGSTPRTFGAVTQYINETLAAGGFLTKVATATITEPTRPEGSKSYGLQVETSSLETVTFKAAAGDTRPSVYLAGSTAVSTTTAATAGTAASSTTTTTGLVTKLTGIDAAQPLNGFSADIAAKNASANARAIARGADGSLFVVGSTAGTVDGVTPKGNSDVFVSKYSSEGKLVWTRLLGSAAPADGFAIAVSDTGTIAVAGAVNGKSDATATGGKQDGFVAAFDSEGRDLWSYQKGALADDSVSAISFAADGSLIVAGTTKGAIGGQAIAGGSDAYVQSFTATGSVAWTRTIGTAGNDEATALAIRGGDVFIATGGPGGGISKLDLVSGSVDSGFSVSAASLGQSTIGALTISNGSLVAGGNAADNAADALVASIDPDTEAVAFTQRLSDFGTLRALASGAGQIVAAGDNRAGGPSLREGTVTGLNGTTGGVLWSEAIEGKAGRTKDGVTTSTGSVTLSGLVIAPDESRSLAALGLPNGDLKLGDVQAITDRTALRAGDYFDVAVDDGPARRITIAQGETFRTLVTKINRAIGGAGTASTTRGLTGDKLTITPSTNRAIEVLPGKGTADALEQLGVPAGIVTAPNKRAAARDASSDNPRVIALEIPSGLTLADGASARKAQTSLNAVLARIRNGYRDTSQSLEAIEYRLEQRTNGAGAAGGGNAYIQAQTANYQAALARLTGTTA